MGANMKRQPIAHVQVPAWGSMAPVVSIEGSTWNVLDPLQRARRLHVRELNLHAVSPTRAPIVAQYGGRYRRAPGLADEVNGEAWRASRLERLQALRRCSSMGWHVEADLEASPS